MFKLGHPKRMMKVILYFFTYVGYHFLCLVSFKNTVFGISTTFPRYLTKHDLHRKFGSEMATESSREMGGENPSLSVGLATLRVPFPFPLAAGPLQSNNYQGVTRLEAAISFLSNPFRKRAFVGAAQKRNQHRFCDADSLIIIALRRGRDSNPRSLSAQQFSRLP